MFQIVLPSMSDAEAVREAMLQLQSQYFGVTVADYLDLVNGTSTYADEQRGWNDLTDIQIKSVDGGYKLDLPEPKSIRDSHAEGGLIMAQINFGYAVESAVVGAMKAAGIEDTAGNRVTLLKNMHDDLANDKPFGKNLQNEFLLAIENLVKRLEAEND